MAGGRGLITMDTAFTVPMVYPVSFRAYSDLHFKLTDDKTSSFPARTVACGVVFTYLTVRLCDIRAHNGEMSVGTLLMFMPPFVVVAAIITSVARVSLSLSVWGSFLACHVRCDCR